MTCSSVMQGTLSAASKTVTVMHLLSFRCEVGVQVAPRGAGGVCWPDTRGLGGPSLHHGSAVSVLRIEVLWANKHLLFCYLLSLTSLPHWISFFPFFCFPPSLLSFPLSLMKTLKDRSYHFAVGSISVLIAFVDIDPKSPAASCGYCSLI